MRASGEPDAFVVVNGPEDGAEFPVVRAPFHIGFDPSCAVNIRLDTAVRGFGALVTAVSDGYRIRRTDRSPVYVNGKRAGAFRSRIVRSGGSIQIGHTLLCLECSADGLARRSHGIVSESDFGWAVQRVLVGIFRAGVRLFGGVLRIVGRILTSWLAMAAIVFLLYEFWPAFHGIVSSLFRTVYYTVMRAIYNAR